MLNRLLRRQEKQAKMKSILQVILLVLVVGIGLRAQAPVTVRAGHFPNITHSQAVLSEANSWFEKALGSQAKVEWKVFNAGPSVIEALFAGQIDLAYIGPNPAINGYVQSQGRSCASSPARPAAARCWSCAPDARHQKPADFARQEGRDAAARQHAGRGAARLAGRERPQRTEQGGNVQVLPTANADQLTLFQKGDIDAAWAPEPWATRLVQEAGGSVFLDERDAVAGRQVRHHAPDRRTKFLEEHPDVIENLLRAHVEMTEWINANRPKPKRTAQSAEIEKDDRQGRCRRR